MWGSHSLAEPIREGDSVADWQRARLIPTSGIGSEKEAEQRATSALLAVLEVVRDLSLELFTPYGASRAGRAVVECFIEVQFKLNGKAVRPDGLIRISYGKNEWIALVEVKTGSAVLEADQLNDYWDVAREHDFDCVITVSNEIAPSPGVHPTDGLRVRSNSKVNVHHLSWTAILSTAVTVRVHRGVDDVEQSWILGELIRYLEHPASGAMAFEDMGPHWVQVRNDAKDGTLRKIDEGVQDIAQRWDQLMRFAALKLGSEIGDEVAQVLSKTDRDPKARAAHLNDELAGTGTLDAVLRVPNTVGDLHVVADLKARRLTASVGLDAPADRGGRARCSWILNQLGQARPDVVVSAYPRNARIPFSASLAELGENKDLLLGEARKDPAKFEISMTVDMGVGRSTGKKSPGFIDSVLGLINDFYGSVVQNITPWVPKAPKITRPAPLPEPDALSDDTASPVEEDSEPDASEPMAAENLPSRPPWAVASETSDQPDLEAPVSED